MKLPNINPSRLQRVVADLEFNIAYADFDSLCKAVSETEWAKSFVLTQSSVQELVYAHGTITKVDKPPKSVSVEPIQPLDNKATVEFDKNIKMYDEGGKGKKQCPTCQKYVGARNGVCGCGHIFGAKVKPVQVDVQVNEPTKLSDEPEIQRERPSEEYGHGYRSKTWVPAGDCPVKLRSLERDAVQEWAEAVRRSFENRHRSFLTLHGLQYWAKDFYPSFRAGPLAPGVDGNNPDYLKVVEILREIYHEDYLHEKGQ